jgi:hypothetical protein
MIRFVGLEICNRNRHYEFYPELTANTEHFNECYIQANSINTGFSLNIIMFPQGTYTSDKIPGSPGLP